MKKIKLLLPIIALLVLLAGCAHTDPTPSDEGGTDAPGETVVVSRDFPSVSINESLEKPTDENRLPIFVAPVNAVALDLVKGGDISTDRMQFTYDAYGRILTTTYTVSNHDITVEYRYEADGIAVTAVCDGMPAVDAVYYPTAGFDPSLGYNVFDGYYFYGYRFSV